MKYFATSLLAGLLAIAGGPAALAQDCTTGQVAAGPLRYTVKAGAPRVNRRVMGPVEHFVQGVPAEPVDSFAYDGEGSTPTEGTLQMWIDPVAEVGVIQAQWTDEHGEWTFEQKKLVHPEHWSGMRIGSSYQIVDWFLNEGATINVYMHGDTGVGMPVMPTMFAYMALWGPAEVTLNGRRFVNPFEFPAPLWLAHSMVSEGVRRDDGTVRALDGSIYDPSKGDQGSVEPEGDLEVHLVFHDERFPMNDNVPPLFSFFYHVVFEDVAIEIVQANDAIPCEPDDDSDDGPTPLFKTKRQAGRGF